MAPPLAVAAGVLVLAGLAAGPINPLIATVQQERVPTALRGRVFGALTAVGFVVTPLGLALGGYLLERIGLRATLLAIAACYLTVTLSMLVNPALRDLGQPPPGENTLGPHGDAADDRAADVGR